MKTWVTLALVLWLSAAYSASDMKPQSKGGVSLLYQNNGNWTQYSEHTGALLFHETLSHVDASATCAASSETLLQLDPNNLKNAAASDLLKQFSYLEYLGDVAPGSRYWIKSTKAGKNCAAFEPLSSKIVNVSCNTALPFLCSNSAPVTSTVDTDFSSSPRTVVKSSNLTFTGTRDRMTFRFTGIPYAAPPIGKLRFQYPQAYTGSEIDATALKPACLQFGFFDGNDLGLNPWGNSEDCLFLNVYTPYLPPSQTPTDMPALKPVLFWIHGGGDVSGTGSDATFDGGSLVSRNDVVIVTINHRLNIFGFLALDDGVVNGNYALADKITALQWVQNHIAAFGGDPSRVTIFGQSAGGSSVLDLLVSPKTKGLFVGAISQSGGSSSIQSLEAADEAISPYLDPLCNGVGAERLECLQGLDSDILLNITNSVGTWITVTDGVYAVGGAISQVSKGAEAVTSVPFLSGFMPEEGQSLLGTNISPNATDFKETLSGIVGSNLTNNVVQSGLWNISDTFSVYNATIDVYTDRSLTCGGESFIAAAALASALPVIYVYKMQRAYALSYYNPYALCTFPVGDAQPYYRCHSGDLYEVFGTYHIFDQPLREAADIQYTTLVQDMWGAFARTGNPNPKIAYLEARSYDTTVAVLGRENAFVWPEYTTEAPELALLDYPDLSTGPLPDLERCKVILP